MPLIGQQRKPEAVPSIEGIIASMPEQARTAAERLAHERG
jgi:hypothetical protein